MERIAFGISRLDKTLQGGAPPGSVVLLSGEAGAGAREFMHTAAVLNGVKQVNEEQFNLHYGRLPENATMADEIHYLSFTADRAQFEQEVKLSMEDKLASEGLAQVNFESLAPRYFQKSPVPQEWYADAGESPAHSATLLDVFAETLNEHAEGNLVIIDSLSDLIDTTGHELNWVDIIYFLKGLRSVAHDWGGLVLVHVDHEAITDVQHGQLVDSCTGAFTFSWATGGSVLARTLVLRSFQGVLSRISEDDLVEFETELGDGGFGISDVRKIR